MTKWEILFVLCVPFVIGASLMSWWAQFNYPDLEHRRLVLDCMMEVGWETTDEDADVPAQLEQSRVWCEDFVRGDSL